MKSQEIEQTSPRALMQFVLPLLWLAMCYGVRFEVMENIRWVEECAPPASLWVCELRSLLGLTIHFGVLAWSALALSIPAFLLAGNRGRMLAWGSLALAIPALTLYTVTLAVFALLLSLLRLVRDERQSDSDNIADTIAQPNA